ncbi:MULTISPECIES: hypothetical protein [unclassified Bradyrhizobium]|uniref:hypothetical protein n=1 Tax=unclassified Bradyrhizobium TaxID=2631580 RepID=UPI001BA8A313|nr:MULTISPECIES: hypothetical protein [unclassified Bradyrhizobium]MBR1227999.1 hypothetical protein [Bradyrhizobium sp. AUGA SZCCT0176]MBR1296007.1 hypothetical protein [Bradyrhizobium sp. AUGA SZCCT0042]
MKRTRLTQLALVAVVALRVLGGLCPDPAHADEVPNRGRAEYLHFSLDMTPIRISLVNDAVGKANFPDLVVPRAYVVFVESAPPSSKGPLPPLLKSDDVLLMFVGGSGEAWSVAVAAKARRDGIDQNTAGHRMRAEETVVQIKTSAHADFAEFARANVMRSAPNRQDDSFEGLAHYRGVASYSNYIGGYDDEFFSTQCEAKLNPVFLCKYTMSITEGVVAYVSFVDFRLYGGRAYANHRLRFVREVVCRYLTRC